ncbi:ABC transporter substrate-binding protein [Nonomuraea maritima]|uniref:ABC transporter substrate-binding protein n=1 Tax=Nonomuraea maritima TaxID=683260 RepID=UPI00371DCB26
MKDGLTRRGFLGASLLFAGGSLVACNASDPTGKASAGGAKITLNQYYHAYGEKGVQQAVQRYAAEYTKANPDVAVNITWVGGEYETRLNAALLTPQAPDIFEIGDFRYQMIKNGQLAPLDDIINPAEYVKANVDNVTADGKVYGVKMMDDIMMLYYRKSVLEAAGVTPPTTFDELATAAKKLTTDKMKGLFVGNDGVGDAGYLLLWSGGGDVIKDGKATFQEGAEAISGLRRLHQDGSLLLGFPTDWYDPGAIVQNAVAMQWCGLWAMPDIQKALGDDFGVIPWPAFTSGGTSVGRLGGWYELVNAKSRHVDEAKKYVQWLWAKQDDLQQDFCLNYGFHVPARTPVAEKALQGGKLASGPAKEAVAISQQSGRSFPALWNTAMGTAFGQAVAGVAKGEGDAAGLLGDAAAKVQAELDKQLA